MVNIVLKIVDDNDKFVGFIKDSLLNLSNNPDNAVSCEVTNKFELTETINKYQMTLDKILLSDNLNSSPIQKIGNRIYSKYYNNYKSGQLKVIPMPKNKYL